MPGKLIIFCGKVIKKSLNFIDEYLYEPWLVVFVAGEAMFEDGSHVTARTPAGKLSHHTGPQIQSSQVTQLQLGMMPLAVFIRTLKSH